MYKVVFKKRVLSFLIKHKWEKVIDVFYLCTEIMKNKPFDNSLDIKKLKNSKTWQYRLRIWKYRFLFNINNDEIKIIFVDAWSRWWIYKN